MTRRYIAEVGYSRATVREIAREAEMTSGNLYYYFPNKSALVIAAYTEFTESVVPRLIAAGERGHTFRDRLLAVLDEAEEMLREYPDIAAFDRAIQVETPQHLHLSEVSAKVFTTLRDMILDIIRQGKREGGLGRDVDVQAAANVVWALFRGLTEVGATAAPNEFHDA